MSSLLAADLMPPGPGTLSDLVPAMGQALTGGDRPAWGCLMRHGTYSCWLMEWARRTSSIFAILPQLCRR